MQLALHTVHAALAAQQRWHSVTWRLVTMRLTYDANVRREGSRAEQQHDLWLVQVPLSGVRLEPWLLLTNWPVTDAESAVRIFRMNRQRSGVEDAFKFTKECLGWEDVQLLDLAGIRTLVALAWVTAEEFLRVYVDEHGALPPRMAALLGNWSRPKLRVNVSHKNS